MLVLCEAWRGLRLSKERIVGMHSHAGLVACTTCKA